MGIKKIKEMRNDLELRDELTQKGKAKRGNKNGNPRYLKSLNLSNLL